MKLILDTHAFIWFGVGDTSKIGKKALVAFSDTNNEIYLSMASLWEMAIKINIGKLKLPVSLEELISKSKTNGIKILPISESHILAYQNLHLHHADPFDRLIISSAYSEDYGILTCDDKFKLYENLTIVW